MSSGSSQKKFKIWNLSWIFAWILIWIWNLIWILQPDRFPFSVYFIWVTIFGSETPFSLKTKICYFFPKVIFSTSCLNTFSVHLCELKLLGNLKKYSSFFEKKKVKYFNTGSPSTWDHREESINSLSDNHTGGQNLCPGKGERAFNN